ncbi:MAG: 30S ribosomal protein S8 [Candidatus Omnitrophota bacterium]|nr:30S ribosomal protein S8 [Candidatus Omnitrophota bacterium]RKY33998.1 MAG: 30S ribosomal protein S8 [Candidatus Omnitrophota bacterium]RKY45140.1 MAG: 30S ribosomal protein S8 [Candidatus Omnitrophota bacterium]
MSRTDLLADAFTMIRNAVRAKKEEAIIPHSKILLRIIEILKSEGYIENFKEMDVPPRKMIKVYLKYDGKKSAINDIQRISKPGRRIYAKRKNIPRIFQGYGIAIISTSKGILTDKEARKEGIGGEVIGYVW